VLPFGPWANALTAIQAGELKGMRPSNERTWVI